ncbi:hypothetical protein ACGVWS_04575 [Enterobacteriaceae bacterium LUAb1]
MGVENQIAENIISVLCEKKQNYANIFFERTGSVFLSFTKDMGYLAWDFLDTEKRSENQDDRIILFKRLSKFLNKEDLKIIIRVIINDFIKKAKKRSASYKVASIAGKLAGQQFINLVFLDDFSKVMAERFIAKIAVKAAFSITLSLGAMTSRAIYTSRELQKRCPYIYDELRTPGDLNFFYFLVEEYCNCFLDALVIRDRDINSFNKIIDLVNKGMAHKKCIF